MMEVLHPHCAGLDVHKGSVVACVCHLMGGAVKREVRSFQTTTKGLMALSQWLSAEGCTHIVMEATGVYWKPVWHILSDGDFELVLANAAHVRNVPGRKTDVNDATWLAELLAHGLVRGSFVPDEPTQEMRTLLRTRKAAGARAQPPYPAAAEDAGGRATARVKSEWPRARSCEVIFVRVAGPRSARDHGCY
jgi:transposase